MEKIIVYTNEQCPYCKQIKDELIKNNIKFENRFTSEFISEWQDVSRLTNIGTIPTIVYKNNYFISGRDFGNPSHLVTILNNFKESSFSIEQQVFERVKTLNYNINIAFNRIDNLLKKIENKLNIEDEYKSTN